VNLFGPLVAFDEITLDELNTCLVAWEHKMGPWRRPAYGREWFHGLRFNGELVAVVAAARLITATAGGFGRDEAFEVGRVCAGRPHLNTACLRLWREAVFPALCREHGFRWAISYQDRKLHTGGLYKWDGWVWLGQSSSGTDARSGVVGRPKTIWGWCADAEERARIASEREAMRPPDKRPRAAASVKVAS
jgi:antitoxin VapB